MSDGLSGIGRRSLSTGGSSVELILSEIPFFSVGLLGFGVMTFLLAMKKVNLLSVFLYASILFSFSGGILDLSQILTRGTANVDRGQGADSVRGVINTREVVFAFSVGLRFMFYWTLVGTCPRSERKPRNRSTQPSPSPPDDSNLHSASWNRWGTQGLVLKYISLLLVIIIPILQIVWRVSPQQSFSTTYIAESAIGIVLSTTFILKLLLNVYLSPRKPWWLQFRSYLAPIVGLALNTSVDIGNISSFRFSEGTLGRFLQAIEMYILVEYLLIATFYHLSLPGNNSPLLPTSVQEKSPQRPAEFGSPINKDMPPIPPSPVPKSPSLPRQELPTGPNSRSGHHSHTASMLSNWIASRRTSRRPSSGDDHLWDRDQADQAELGMADGDLGVPRQETPDVVSPLVQEALAYQQSTPAPTPVPLGPRYPLPSSRRTGLRAISVVDAQDKPVTPLGGVVVQRERANTVPLDDDSRVSISSYYGLEGSPSLLPPRPLPLTNRLSSGASSDVSIGELRRQQSDLDKSIATLRLFSPQSTTPPPNLLTSSFRQSISRTRNSANTLGSDGSYRAESAAASEFSLSHFPNPPDEEDLANPRPRSRTGTLPPPKVPPIGIPPRDSPDSSSPERAPSTPWYGSAGTQVDVTSFLGEWLPPSGALPLTGTPKPSSSTSAQLDAREVRRPVLRPLLLAPSADSMVAAQSAIVYNSLPGATITSQPLNTSLPRPVRTGLPPRPRIAISGPTGPRPSQAKDSIPRQPSLKPPSRENT
ncbi:hypothetical protein EYR40_004129 [Pleurotus pulmonarius]|nr:hypothetical protein EYR40_004129 [Pleurotus pulmonarius]KAF4606833.1 hypothetical protein EYR38_000888 [Pleurotus pulmonarius]